MENGISLMMILSMWQRLKMSSSPTLEEPTQKPSSIRVQREDFSYFLEKEIESSEALNQASAYMLVYVRKNQCAELLKPITGEDIPTKLIEEIEKTKKNDEERVIQFFFFKKSEEKRRGVL